MSAGKQVVKYQMIHEAECALCGKECFGFNCNRCRTTVCIDCECPCFATPETEGCES